jgi:hypothetical protein
MTHTFSSSSSETLFIFLISPWVSTGLLLAAAAAPAAAPAHELGFARASA